MVKDDQTRLAGQPQAPGLSDGHRLGKPSRRAHPPRLERERAGNGEQAPGMVGSLELLEPTGQQQKGERLASSTSVASVASDRRRRLMAGGQVSRRRQADRPLSY